MRYDESQVKELAARVVKTYDKRGYKCTSVGAFCSYRGITMQFEKNGVTQIGVTVTDEGKYKYEGTRRSEGTNNLYIVLERTDEYVSRQVSRIAELKINKENSDKVKVEMVSVFGAPENKEDGRGSYGEYEIKYGPVNVEGKVNAAGVVAFTVGLNTKYDNSVIATSEQIKQVIAIFNQTKV